MATGIIDTPSLESLLIQALNSSDRLGYHQVGGHVAVAIDALRKEAACARPRGPAPTLYPMASLR